VERIADLNIAEKDVLKKVNQLLYGIREAVEVEPTGLAVGIGILQRLCQEIYEDLNQIQHEAMILRTARSLQGRELAEQNVESYWNPRQTGTAEEPDPRGIIAGRIVVSAEITTSDPNLTPAIADVKLQEETFHYNKLLQSGRGSEGLKPGWGPKSHSLKGTVGHSHELHSQKEGTTIQFHPHCFDLLQVFNHLS